MSSLITIIMHDTLDETLPLYREMWRDLSGAFIINHIFKADGKQSKGLVQYGPEHSMPDKKVCVMTPVEARTANITPIDLLDYSHPSECAYIFGPDNDIRGWHEKFKWIPHENGIDVINIEDDIDYVSITTPGNTELYSFMAATIVLGHRLMTEK